MGKNFETGSTRIGRNRLPAGLIAVPGGGTALRQAVDELLDYATRNREPNRPRRGILFRVVEPWEQQAIMHRLCDFFGDRVGEHDRAFSVPIGHWHLMDDSAVSHACNRHAFTETPHHRLALGREDFHRIPEVVNPRNIREFAMTGRRPRIIYERQSDRFALVVVQEIQTKTIVVKTVYRK